MRIFNRLFFSVALLAMVSCKKDEEPNSNSNNNNNSGSGGLSASAHSCGESNVHNGSVPYGTLTDQDGNTYKTVVIGDQKWMAENLKTSKYRNGDAILTGLSVDEWWEPSGGAWCYYGDNSEYSCPYGKLYNWGVVEDPRNVCPSGWHVPTEQEWTDLFAEVGGESIAGTALTSKSDEWFNVDGMTNSAGFSALPGGYRDGSGMLGFILEGFNASFWTSTFSDPWYAVAVNLDGTADVDFRETFPEDGCSIRCVED
jgi:uncharacterized protein (TIGR02145 family)